MAEVKRYNLEGKETGSVTLSDDLFAREVKPHVVHEVFVAQLANGRSLISSTKDRSEVRGGGKKPWKQKGTGRARHGSRRSPIWVGGGITFGPTLNRVFGKKVNKKMRKEALRMVLSDKVNNDVFIAVDEMRFDDTKTKQAAKMRAALPGANATALIVLTKEEREAARAVENLPKTEAISAESLNVRDLLKFTYVIASEAAIERMQKTYSK
ncbi:MAG: 50S ribosomal protein L4 [bacterium]|nr:50S ribosomal protein L4 [bacterium]MDA1024365.1 50S ribosomal protein L4 [bacterium]